MQKVADIRAFLSRAVSKSNGQVFEVEGGENVYIMKKTASAEINALSALNEAHGGNSFGTSGLYKAC